MIDLYTLGDYVYELPHGSYATQVTLSGRKRARVRQVTVLKELHWVYRNVLRMNGGESFIVYARADHTPEENRVIEATLSDVHDLGAILAPVTPDLNPDELFRGPYPHEGEVLADAVRRQAIAPDAYGVRIFFHSPSGYDAVLYHAVRMTLAEAQLTAGHVERCKGCLAQYRSKTHFDAEVSMTDVVPLAVIPF